MFRQSSPGYSQRMIALPLLALVGKLLALIVFGPIIVLLLIVYLIMKAAK